MKIGYFIYNRVLPTVIVCGLILAACVLFDRVTVKHTPKDDYDLPPLHIVTILLDGQKIVVPVFCTNIQVTVH